MRVLIRSRGAGAALLLLGVAALGCSPPPAETAPPLAQQTSPRASPPEAVETPAPSVPVQDGGPVVAGPTRPTSSTSKSEEPEGQFPPPGVEPMHEGTASDGDGIWAAWPVAAMDTQDPVVVRTVLHPHPRSKWQSVTVAAFDQQRLAFGHRPGTQDVDDTNHPELLDRAGLVPAQQQPRLLAVFNGGFQPRHGWWGMFSLDTTLVEPRPDGCTVFIRNDRRMGIAPHPAIEEQVEQLTSYRQTPPCLVAAGELHPRLVAGDDRAWGGNHPDRKTRRRSAAGVSEDGRTFFYALGSETEPRRLAEALLAAGAHDAAQLDINWNWTRLFVFDPSAAEGNEDAAPRDDSSGSAATPGVVGSLVEQMARDKGEYVTRRSKRGFFFVVRRGPH